MDITLIGAGHVATHLGRAMHLAEHRIVQVFSRQLSNAQVLAEKLDAEAVNDLKQIHSETDLLVLSVHDDAIRQVSELLSQYLDQPVAMVHTSGAISIDHLQATEAGVLYPVQTFNKDRPLDFSDIPVCVHANTASLLQKLDALASSLSSEVCHLSDEQRAALHIAAVFVNNFSNICMRIGQEVCFNENIDFSILHALALETAVKAIDLGPGAAQTGPALRGDVQTQSRHKAYLDQYFSEYSELYELLSKSISANRSKTNST